MTRCSGLLHHIRLFAADSLIKIENSALISGTCALIDYFNTLQKKSNDEQGLCWVLDNKADFIRRGLWTVILAVSIALPAWAAGLSAAEKNTFDSAGADVLNPDFSAIGADSVANIRDQLLHNLPRNKRMTFRDEPYGWGSWTYDLVSNEALAAGSAMTAMAVAASISAYIKPWARAGVGEFLGQYGSLFTDVGVDLLTSDRWEEFGFRTGTSLLSWMGSDYLGTGQLFVMRYLLSHGALLAETLPDIWHWMLPHLKGSRDLICLDPRVCEVVSLQYHIPDEVFSPDTGQPWISIEFPWGGEISEPENELEQALWNLRFWAQERGVEAVHLYPDIDDGHIRLWARTWQNGMSGKLYLVPGRYGIGSRSVWWTNLFHEHVPRLTDRKLINPLHSDVLSVLPQVLSGEEIDPVHPQGTDQVIGNGHHLTSVSTGETGFVILDQHISRGYELPDIYLETSLPLDQVTGRALQGLDLRRSPAPDRGGKRLLTGIARAALYRAAFDWALSKLQMPRKLKPDSEKKVSEQKQKQVEKGANTFGSRDGNTEIDTLHDVLQEVPSEISPQEGKGDQNAKVVRWADEAFDIPEITEDQILAAVENLDLDLDLDLEPEPVGGRDQPQGDMYDDNGEDTRLFLQAITRAQSAQEEIQTAPAVEVSDTTETVVDEPHQAKDTLGETSESVVQAVSVVSASEVAGEPAEVSTAMPEKKKPWYGKEFLNRLNDLAQQRGLSLVTNEDGVPKLFRDGVLYFDPSAHPKKVLVLGQKGAGKSAFIQYVTGLEDKLAYQQGVTDKSPGRIYQPVSIGELGQRVRFAEVSVGATDSGEELEVSVKSTDLANMIADSNKVVWCGDIRCHGVRNAEPEQEKGLFRNIVSLVEQKGKDLYVALTFSEDANIREKEGVSSIAKNGDATVDEMRLGQLYHRAIGRYRSYAAEEAQNAGAQVIAKARTGLLESHQPHPIHATEEERERFVVLKKEVEAEVVALRKQARTVEERMQLSANTIGLAGQSRQSDEKLHYKALKRVSGNENIGWWAHIQSYLLSPTKEAETMVHESPASEQVETILPAEVQESESPSLSPSIDGDRVDN